MEQANNSPYCCPWVDWLHAGFVCVTTMNEYCTVRKAAILSQLPGNWEMAVFYHLNLKTSVLAIMFRSHGNSSVLLDAHLQFVLPV